MDTDVINLAKAIRQAETGNRPVAGKSGELPSRYQFLPSTWKSWSKQYLGVENAPITLENENKVAYSKIKELKDKGMNPAQIASIWNSGSPNWQGKVGVNKMGVAYDVPKYVNRVYSEYQKIKGSTQAPQRLQQPVAPTTEERRQDRMSQGLPVARNPERVEPTLGGTIARDVLKTPARLLENVRAIPRVLQGESLAEIDKGRDSKYFGGKIAPIGTKPVENLGDFGENLKEAVGAGTELASYLPFAGAVTKTAGVIKPLTKQFGKQAFKTAGKRILGGAVEGAVGTAMFEGGKRMTGEKDRGNFLENVAYGTAGGAGLGLVGAGLSRGLRQARRTVASIGGKIPEDIATESTQRLKGAWTALNDDYKDLRTFRNKQAKYGRSVEDILTEEVLVPEIKDGKVDTQKLLPEVDARIQKQAGQITEFAKKFDDRPIPIQSVKDIAEKVIRETPSITATGELKSALAEVARRMDGIKEVYGDTLVPSQLNTIRVQMNQLTKAFGGDVFKQDVADAIADAVREKLDDVIQDDVFRRANAKVGDLINIRKYLQKVDGKQVGGGRFSQAFAGVIGSIVGGEINKGGLPVAGPILGALGARSVVRGARQYAFGSAGPRTRSILRRMQRKNEIGAEIAQKTAKKEQLLLPARTSANNVRLESGKSINLPSRSQSTVDKTELADIILQKSKKGDVFKLDGKEFEITRVLEDGVMVVDNNGNKDFISAGEITKAKKVDMNFAEKEEITNRTVKKSGVTKEASLASKANEMSFDDFKKFYDENKSQFREDIGGDIKKFWEANNFGGEQAFGAVAGLEIDENGDLKFNKKNALIGVGGMAVAKKAGLMPKPAIPKENIVKRLPDLNTNKEISGKDIAGNKFTIKSGEALAVYEMKGNKILVKGDKDITVNKNQFQNIQNQSVSAKAERFAPELEGLEEVVGGENLTIGLSEKVRAGLKDADYLGFDSQSQMLNALKNDPLSNFDIPKDILPEIEKWKTHNSKFKPTKYSQYTLPNGENYREVLIKAPITDEAKKLPTGYKITNVSGLWSIFDKNGELVVGHRATKEGAIQALNTEGSATRKTLNFKSSHWDEPNVISHLRLNDRTYKGKKVTFMEELQSDWAREGRSKGFTSDVVLKWEKQPSGDLVTTGKDGSRITITPEGSKFYLFGGKSNELGATYPTLEQAKSYAQNYVGNGVPSNPALKNWQELSIKRALKDAVDNNSDYFAWINGEQTSARYNLATYVDDVNWKKGTPIRAGEDLKIVKLKPKSGNDISLTINKTGDIVETGHSDWQGKKLDEVLGKGLADKIMEKESGTLSGEGLKFGGEWANNLYDKQVKSIVEDLTGQKVEMLDMGLPIEKDISKYAFRIPQTKTDITPKNLKIGQEVDVYGETNIYKVTKKLSDKKFEAVDLYELGKIKLKKAEFSEGYQVLPDKFVYPTKEQAIKAQEKVIKDITKTFEIPDKVEPKTTQQQGIKLTPEVKAIIKGEAKPLKKPKNPLPYEVAYSIIPLIFLLFNKEQSTA